VVIEYSTPPGTRYPTDFALIVSSGFRDLDREAVKMVYYRWRIEQGCPGQRTRKKIEFKLPE
jgi:outer membrane biosynthesis protein TonB